MKKDKASYTAEIMALYRAMENSRPPHLRLFEDPYASCFLGPRLRFGSRLAAFPAGERWLYRYMQRRIPGALASGLARTRYIDDLLLNRIQRGVRQVVILGAGFDTRAHRLRALDGIPVLEVDHPNTAARKKALLKNASAHLSSTLSYLSVDFNRQNLRELLSDRQIGQPTVFLWEGVTNYLEAPAIADVMTMIGTLPAGSSLIFTYVDRDVLDHPAGWYGAERLLADLHDVGEKWTFGIAPEQLRDWLQSFGLRLTGDKSALEYRNTYIPERKSLLNGYEFYHVAEAEV